MTMTCSNDADARAASPSRRARSWAGRLSLLSPLATVRMSPVGSVGSAVSCRSLPHTIQIGSGLSTRGTRCQGRLVVAGFE